MPLNAPGVESFLRTGEGSSPETIRWMLRMISTLSRLRLWYAHSRDHVRNSRVDIHTDNRTLKAALDNFGCKNSSVNDSVKEILECSRQLNLAIDVHYVPSRDNMADAPSRACSDLDCMLSEQAWNSVERRFGPHSFDLMALDSNCRRDRSGP